MKFFLVISIIAFWWVPTHSPGNIGISLENISEATPIREVKIKYSGVDQSIESQNITKRKMDHFGNRWRKLSLTKD
ncbi:hypothetical protein [Marivirga sp.]|uniref:hypothetical protein n=1 Tax=Marivirga sp. TaxID=2018662 RepID=UPI002D80A07A|nr:hypothetical protein [Marivirga sp.]HET8861594.1 hypothetical protein [Marivirga sp.]